MAVAKFCFFLYGIANGLNFGRIGCLKDDAIIPARSLSVRLFHF